MGTWRVSYGQKKEPKKSNLDFQPSQYAVDNLGHFFHSKKSFEKVEIIFFKLKFGDISPQKYIYIL